MAVGREQEKKDTWTAIRVWANELGLRLIRDIWDPLDRTVGTFHILPLVAAFVVVFVLATDGQLREIYLSYLEELKADGLARKAEAITAIVFAAAGFTLISALLFQAHYWLSSSQKSVILASHANPDAGSMVLTVQRTVAIVLALSPWFGLAAGLFHAEFYLASMANKYLALSQFALRDLNPPTMTQYLPTPNLWWIALTIMLLGLATAYFAELHRQNSFLRNLIVITTPIATISMFILLTNYVPNNPEAIFTVISWLAVLTLVATVIYHYFHRRLNLPILYLDPSRRYKGFNLLAHRRKLLFSFLFLPWALIALYFSIAAISTELPSEIGSLPAANRWAAIPIAVSVTVMMGLAVTQLLVSLREKAVLQQSIIAVIVALAVLSRLFSALIGTQSVVWLYRFIGPLGTMALGLLFLISILVLLAWLSQKSRLPAMSLVVLTVVIIVFSHPIWVPVTVILVVCLLATLMAVVSESYAKAGIAVVVATVSVIMVKQSIVSVRLPLPVPTDKNQQVTSFTGSVCERFQTWLEQKKWLDKQRDGTVQSSSGPLSCPSLIGSRTSRSKDDYHPAFIIAVEGGGIYAASAASLFLATMQEAAPNFSDHVFAVSGVSGGSIGATVFAALNQESAAASTATVQRSSTGCPSPRTAAAQPRQKSLDAVRTIMQDDHFSPVVGSIFPELLGSSIGRAETLAASFVSSVFSQDSAAAEIICAFPFADYWSEKKQGPALILNATWAETGSRVAFAPFPLHQIDESLYSFADKEMPLLNGAVKLPESASKSIESQSFYASLINAAIVSARFPGILPPFSLWVDTTADTNATSQEGRGRTLRWNFVDGGYSDSSGAATALALYQALEGIAEQHKVNLQIIIVTSVDTQPDLDKITGTAFRDTLAPINAVLKVREAEGKASVARACNRFYRNNDNRDIDQKKIPCEEHTQPWADDLQIVQVESETYGLPLGWKLSHTTFAVISWMLGSIEQDPTKPCADYPKYSNEKAELFRSHERNSCVLSSIAQALQAEQLGQR